MPQIIKNIIAVLIAALLVIAIYYGYEGVSLLKGQIDGVSSASKSDSADKLFTQKNKDKYDWINLSGEYGYYALILNRKDYKKEEIEKFEKFISGEESKLSCKYDIYISNDDKAASKYLEKLRKRSEDQISIKKMDGLILTGRAEKDKLKSALFSVDVINSFSIESVFMDEGYHTIVLEGE